MVMRGGALTRNRRAPIHVERVAAPAAAGHSTGIGSVGSTDCELVSPISFGPIVVTFEFALENCRRTFSIERKIRHQRNKVAN
jgi:hypothetical protein